MHDNFVSLFHYNRWADERLVKAYRVLSPGHPPQQAGGLAESAALGLLRHVVNHASYHRGQLSSMLRRLGLEPPATDLVLWEAQETQAGR